MDQATRVSLDTNLWSFIGDQGQSAAFEALVAKHKLSVVIPPSTLLEVLRIPAAEPRSKIVAALKAGPRQRLPSEAQLESQELVSEARRTRPQWFRAMPDTGKIASLNAFWTKRVWRAASDDPIPLHEFVKRESRVREYIIAQQREQRAEVLRTGFDISRISSLQATASLRPGQDDIGGWDGRPVDLWRIHMRNFYWHQLATLAPRAEVTGEDPTFADWIGAELDLRRVTADVRDFTVFWLRDVQLAAVPRNWLHLAVQMVQTARKITPGNAADAQHSTYLVDCDIYLTADVGYAQTLALVRSDAPMKMAEPRIVRYDRERPIVDAIACALEAATMPSEGRKPD